MTHFLYRISKLEVGYEIKWKGGFGQKTTKPLLYACSLLDPQPFWEQIKVLVWKEQHKEFSILE